MGAGTRRTSEVNGETLGKTNRSPNHSTRWPARVVEVWGRARGVCQGELKRGGVGVLLNPKKGRMQLSARKTEETYEPLKAAVTLPIIGKWEAAKAYGKACPST